MNPAEQKISKALDHAVDLKRQGKSPDDCMIDSAKKAGLNADMTERLVEAFNIALTNSSLRKMADKTASFPIASKTAVLRGVFCDLEPEDKSKTASSAPGEGFFSIERSSPALNWPGTGTLRKTAELSGPVIAKAYGACDISRSMLSKLAQDVMAAEMRMADTFNGLCVRLSLSDGLDKFAAIEHQALAEYGPQYAPILQNIYEAAGLDRLKVARFSGQPDIGAYFPPDATWLAFQDNVSATKELIQIQGAYQKLAMETEKLVRETQNLVGELNNPVKIKKRAADLVGTGFDFSIEKTAEGDDKSSKGGPSLSFSKAIPQVFDKEHALISSAQSGVSGGITDEYQKAHTEAQKAHFRGPKDEMGMEADNIRRHRILAELVSNDDIISRMPHADIERSYGSLLSLSPDLTLDPSVVAGWLRNSSSTQALDPFAAGQLVKTQQDLMKNRLLGSGQLKPA